MSLPTRNTASRRKVHKAADLLPSRESSPVSTLTVESLEALDQSNKMDSQKLTCVKRKQDLSGDAEMRCKKQQAREDFDNDDFAPQPAPLADLRGVPTTIEVTSINDEFSGTFHLHEFLQAVSPGDAGGSQLRHPHGRLPACVTDTSSGARITPREAERRAGKGSRKAWKQTLRTAVGGSEISLQRYFLQLGIDACDGAAGTGGGAQAEELSGSGGDGSTEFKAELCTTERPGVPGLALITAGSDPCGWWPCGDQSATSTMQGMLPLSVFPFAGAAFPAAHMPGGPYAWLDPTTWSASSSAASTPTCLLGMHPAAASLALASCASFSQGAVGSGAPPMAGASGGPFLPFLDGCGATVVQPGGPPLPPMLLPLPGSREDDPGFPLSEEVQAPQARVPPTVAIFSGNGKPDDVHCTFYLHEFLKGFPTKPPGCIEIHGVRGGGAGAPTRITPSAAEAEAGRGCRKNWKETFKTWQDGRIITLKTFFALHGI